MSDNTWKHHKNLFFYAYSRARPNFRRALAAAAKLTRTCSCHALQTGGLLCCGTRRLIPDISGKKTIKNNGRTMCLLFSDNLNCTLEGSAACDSLKVYATFHYTKPNCLGIESIRRNIKKLWGPKLGLDHSSKRPHPTPTFTHMVKERLV